jgi:CRISPR-associated protein Csx16
MLINLSNHPSTAWDIKQYKTAQASFNSIIDLPFPFINPEAGTSEIAMLAKEYYTTIMNIMNDLAVDDPIVVHVMGELNFCFSLINMLLNAGIQCVASTTRRNVFYAEDGSKNSIFEFIQFRDYKLPK